MSSMPRVPNWVWCDECSTCHPVSSVTMGWSCWRWHHDLYADPVRRPLTIRKLLENR